MKELLKVANEQNFAVPGFNIGTGQILKAVTEECERKQAPVILAIHPSELEFQGDNFIQSCRAAANASKVPMTIHLDYGSEMNQILRAIHTGFTSVMIDASGKSFEDNVAITKQDMLSEIKSKGSIPLVLHGGSANKDTEIAESVKRGINKINIASDIKDAFYQELRKTLTADAHIPSRYMKKMQEDIDISFFNGII